MQEIWKDVIGFEGFYKVSTLGNVKSLDRIEYVNRSDCGLIQRNRKGRPMKPKLSNTGYLILNLRNNSTGRSKYFSIHRLVAENFIDNHDGKPTVNHLDSNKTNNCVSNLEWSTHSEQMRHAVDNNLLKIRGKPKFDLEFKQKILDHFLNNDISILKLADMFGISARTAGRVVKGLTFEYQKELQNKQKEVEEIKQLRQSGATYKEISLKFGIGISQTKRICDNESRKE